MRTGPRKGARARGGTRVGGEEEREEEPEMEPEGERRPRLGFAIVVAERMEQKEALDKPYVSLENEKIMKLKYEYDDFKDGAS